MSTHKKCTNIHLNKKPIKNSPVEYIRQCVCWIIYNNRMNKNVNVAKRTLERGRKREYKNVSIE